MALEALGAVGAACQLAGQCIYVLEIVEKLRRSTETLKEYQTQLHGLRVLSETIRQNPLLQTREIISHTQCILEAIQEHDDLTPLLEKRRLFRIWGFLRVERRLLEHTKNLEILKSTLAISIQDQQCRTLNKIERSTEMTAMAQAVDRDYDNVMASGLENNAWYHRRQVARFERTGDSPALHHDSGHFAGTRAGESVSNDSQRTLVGNCIDVGSDISSWVRNTASANVDQHNGHTVIGVTKDGFLDSRHEIWADNRKDGPGVLRNGHHFKSSIGGFVQTPRVIGGHWTGNNATNAQNGNNNSRGPASAKQCNGHLYEAGPEPGQGHRARRRKSGRKGGGNQRRGGANFQGRDSRQD